MSRGGFLWLWVAMLLIGSTRAAAQDVTNGLVAYYPLNGNVSDGLGNGHNGTPTNVTFATGHFDSAAVFDGTTSYVEVDGLALPTGASARSISVWVNPSVSSGHDGNVFAWGLGALNTNDQRFSLLQAGDGILRVIGQFNDYSAGVGLQAGAWTHVVVTYDGINLLVYLNGSQVATMQPSAFNTASGTPFMIGKGTIDRSDEFFIGSIDEVRVYNRALSANEVTTLYGLSTPEVMIPTLSEWGMICMLALLLGTGLLAKRRREQQAESQGAV